MTLHTFTPTHYHTTFGWHEPVLRIADGDTVVTTTVDARGYDAGGEQVAARGNPETGPFYVEGAEPGDAISITIDRAYPNRATGWTRNSVAPHVVDATYVAALPEQALVHWALDLEAGTARLAPASATGPLAGLADLVLPLAPMLGCLGVAPPREQAIVAATSGRYGGNMDWRGLVAGTTVTFPVFAPGALIHLGDGHAVQGDGEIVGTGIETSFEVAFTVNVRKDLELVWPCGETADHIFTIGNARPLDQAVQHATSEMLRRLQDDWGLTPAAASTLLGQVVTYDLGNVYDPAYTMVCKVPKALVKG